MKALFERTSICKYKEEPISDEIIETLLKAAFSAPSARNSQPWHFYVITNREVLVQLSKFSRYSYPLEKAPLGIVVCADISNPKNFDYAQQDCSAATENILIQAKELNIGSCWLGCYPNEERCEYIANILNTPSHIQPLWAISLGYIDEEIRIKDKWNDEKIAYIR